MKTLKRFGLLALALLIPTGLLAQGTVFQATDRFQSSRSSQCYDLTRTAAAANYFLIGWRVIGTVSGGTIKVQQSASNDCSSLSDLIADDDATANGQSAVTQGTPGSIKVTVTSYAGTGTVASWVGAWVSNPAASGTLSGDVTSNMLDIATEASLQDVETAIEAIAAGTAASSVTDDCFGVALTPLRYVSDGLTEDEQEIATAAGKICQIEVQNAHATAGAWVKCTNATAANTTPGTTAILWEWYAAPNYTSGNNNIRRAFSTALTCYIVLGKTAAAVDEVAADDVHYTIYTVLD